MLFIGSANGYRDSVNLYSIIIKAGNLFKIHNKRTMNAQEGIGQCFFNSSRSFLY